MNHSKLLRISKNRGILQMNLKFLTILSIAVLSLCCFTGLMAVSDDSDATITYDHTMDYYVGTSTAEAGTSFT